MKVYFWPEEVGPVTGSVSFTYCGVDVVNSLGCNVHRQEVFATLSGTGIAQSRIIDVLPVSVAGNEAGYLTFGEVAIGEEKTMPFKIRNNGNVQLTYSGLTAALQAIAPATSAHSVYGYSLVPSANTGTVQPGETVTLSVTFYAQVEQAYSDTLTVPSDATSVAGPYGGAATNSIPISATGVQP